MLNLKIEPEARKPKYEQLANQIVEQIETNKLNLNDRLPSVNKLSEQLDISRETVFKALNQLSEKGIIESKKRKGYFVSKTDVNSEFRVFLLLDKFTIFKDNIYHSLFEELGENGEVDVYFHNHNFELFKSLIEENLHNYTHFVVVTFLDKDVRPVLNKIPSNKLIILDCKEEGIQGDYSMIYQDFSEIMYNALKTAHDRLTKYNHLCMVASKSYPHTKLIEPGFWRYCEEHDFDSSIIENVQEAHFNKGTAYITIGADEIDITNLIKLTHKHNYEIGKDIGIISYNETPIKEVLEGGITVISTDFELMGRKAARLIKSNEDKIMSNPSEIILRKSL